MTVRPLHADAFPAASPLSRRHWRIVGRDGMLLEAREELDRRRQVYPGMVSRGTLSQDAATRATEIWRAIIHDLERGVDHADPAFGWEDKVRELRRELALRRNAYPGWIAKPTNPLTEAEAVKRCERLDAIHARYWLELEHWPYDRALDMLAWVAAREQRERRAEWDAAFAGTDPAAADAAAIEARRWATVERVASVGTTADVAPMLRFVEDAGTALAAALTHEAVDDGHHRPFTLWLGAALVRRQLAQLEERKAA